MSIPYGERVNGILIVSRLNTNRAGDTYYKCICMCGVELERTGRNIREGNVYPCESCRIKHGIKLDNK